MSFFVKVLKGNKLLFLMWLFCAMVFFLSIGCGGGSDVGPPSGGGTHDISGIWVVKEASSGKLQPVYPGWIGYINVKLMPGAIFRLYSDADGEYLTAWERKNWGWHYFDRYNHRIKTEVTNYTYDGYKVKIIEEDGKPNVNLSEGDNWVYRLSFVDDDTLVVNVMYTGPPPEGLEDQFSADVSDDIGQLQVSMAFDVTFVKSTEPDVSYLDGVWVSKTDGECLLLPAVSGWAGRVRLKILSPAYLRLFAGSSYITEWRKEDWYISFVDAVDPDKIAKQDYIQEQAYPLEEPILVGDGVLRLTDSMYGATWEYEIHAKTEDTILVKIYYTGEVPPEVQSLFTYTGSASDDIPPLKVYGSMEIEFEKKEPLE